MAGTRIDLDEPVPGGGDTVELKLYPIHLNGLGFQPKALDDLGLYPSLN